MLMFLPLRTFRSIRLDCVVWYSQLRRETGTGLDLQGLWLTWVMMYLRIQWWIMMNHDNHDSSSFSHHFAIFSLALSVSLSFSHDFSITSPCSDPAQHVSLTGPIKGLVIAEFLFGIMAWVPVKAVGALLAAVPLVYTGRKNLESFISCLGFPYAPWCWNIYQLLPQKTPKCR